MAPPVIEPRRNAAVVLTLGIIATVLFAVLTALVVAHRTDTLDRELILSLRAGATPLLTTVLLAVTFTSGKLGIPAAILFGGLLYRQKRRRAAAYYAGACVSAE